MTKQALITGGQQGIGFGIAEALVGAGFEVCLTSYVTPEDNSVQEALTRLGDTARYVQHDVTDLDGIEALLDSVGPIAALVNNAGIGAPVRGDLLDLKPDSWDAVHEVNLRGAFFLTQAVARRMIEMPADTYRSISFIGSVSAAMASVERAEYCVSKAGVAMVAQLFALRLAATGIGVFELRPGIIESGMTAAVHDAYTPRIEGGLVPQRRWGVPSDIGSVVAAVASGQMPFSTGAVIPVDGGLSIPHF